MDINQLAQQIQAQYGGEWNVGGRNRAMELAQLLAANGVTDLASLGITPTTMQNVVSPMGPEGSGGYTENVNSYSLTNNGRPLGFLGDVNNDNSISKVGDFSSLLPQMPNSAGYSSTGEGNTLFNITDQGGKLGFQPHWQESSDAQVIKDTLAIAALAGGGYLGGSYFGGAGAAPAGTSAASGLSSAEAAALMGDGAAAGGGGGFWTGGLGDAVESLGAGGSAGGESVGIDSATRGLLNNAQGYGQGMSGAATGTFDTLSPWIGNEAAASVANGGAGSGLWDAAKAVGNAVSNPRLVGAVAGGLLGANSSRDQQQASNQTSTREPWGPAGDWLKQLMPQAQALQQRYAQNPFSPQQRTLLDQQYGLLNQANQMTPGLLSAASALGNFRKR